MTPRLRVLIIERSVRMMIRLLTYFERRPDMEVVDANQDARALIKAASHIKLAAFMREAAPDAVIVDLCEPVKKDLIWISTLHQMALCPIIAFTRCEVTNKRLGGVRFFEVIPRPDDGDERSIETAMRLLAYAVRRTRAVVGADSISAQNHGPKTASQGYAVNRPLQPDPSGSSSHLPMALRAASGQGRQGVDLIAIAASAGGTQAIPEVVSRLPLFSPPIVAVQHITKGFAEIFADHMDRTCELCVKVAHDGECLLDGHVYIAPDGAHLEIEKRCAGYAARLREDDQSTHVPSADVMFLSVAHQAGRRAAGVILTGMGKDGAMGLLRMREAGGYTIGQDEASCLVYGMPKAAWDMGAVQARLPLDMIAGELIKLFETRGVSDDEDSCS